MRGPILAACVIAVAPAALAQQMSADAQDHMERARQALSRNQFQEAIGEFRRVLKTEKACAECYFQLAHAYQKIGAHKDALESARKALEISPDDAWRAVAHNMIGVELSAMMPDGKIHGQEAEMEFRAAMQLNPNNANTYYNLGGELMKEVRDAEGAAVLMEYLKRAPDTPEAKTARALIDNPRRARQSFAPADFSLVTKDGEYVTLDEVKGKVVLLDFWATWCQPCKDSLPTIRSLAKRYARDQFVLISISVDSNPQDWNRFIAEHHMDWPQAHDQDGRLRRMFNVQPIPTYILMDTEGVMRSLVIGSSLDSVSHLGDAAAKLVKDVRRVEKASGGTANPAPVVAAANTTGTMEKAPAAMPPRSAPTQVEAASAPPRVERLQPPAPRQAPAPVSNDTPLGDKEALQITSTPDGADIYLDQNFIGNAPATVRILPGKHMLRITSSGFRTWNREITAQAGSEARITATLTKFTPGVVEGRVLWNEQPVAGVRVFAKDCNTPEKVGPGVTDSNGHFSIDGAPDGTGCILMEPLDPKQFMIGLYVNYNMPPGGHATAPDSFLCKVFEPVSPRPEQLVFERRPTLKWNPFPDAAGYNVQVWHIAPGYKADFRQGDNDKIKANSIQVDVDLSPGDYYWRVNAFNRLGHPIGCNVPIKFKIGGGSTTGQ